MKVSDYVADFLARQGIGHVFVVTGGAAAHLIDSVARHPKLQYVCPQHEQSAAMAVDAYARVTGKMGAAIVTTGPGVTNLMTGIACLYYDSLPSIFISGQVSTFRLARNAPGVRQLGFQEAPHVEMVRTITKYAVLVEDPQRVPYELNKALYLAQEGRPGPVLIDIPDNVQRMSINFKKCKRFLPPKRTKNLSILSRQVDRALEMVGKAKRPILVLGAAVKIAKMEKQAKAFAERLGIPIALTWAAMDLFDTHHPLNIGGFGISSTRRGNFAIQNADLVFSIGSRLDTHATGSPVTDFAREAKKIIVDINSAELRKFSQQGMKVDLLVQADVRDFFEVLNRKHSKISRPQIQEWLRKILEWRKKYPSCPPGFRKEKRYIIPYVFLEELSKETKRGDVLLTDCGSNLIQTFQAYSIKEGQKVFSAFNNSPMGYSLAASIGACFANNKKPVICIIGDGGLQVNIQELGTIARYNLPIKIFLFNNHGYGIIQQTQEDWLESRYWASRPETGLADPDYIKIAKAYGLKVFNAERHRGLRAIIRKVLSVKGPVLCNLEFNPNQRIVPMLKYGRPIEDASPLMSRREFFENMIIRPMDVSLKKEL